MRRMVQDKIRFYCPIKVPARGRVITVIYITQKTINILIHKCNKQVRIFRSKSRYGPLLVSFTYFRRFLKKKGKKDQFVFTNIMGNLEHRSRQFY
jgi:hypothetical protein